LAKAKDENMFNGNGEAISSQFKQIASRHRMKNARMFAGFALRPASQPDSSLLKNVNFDLKQRKKLVLV